MMDGFEGKIKTQAKQIAALESQLAEARRREELLRAALGASVDNFDFDKVLDYLIANYPLVVTIVSNFIKTDALQAAIDGGALDATQPPD